MNCVIMKKSFASVAELADAQDSGFCDREVVRVRIPSLAPIKDPCVKSDLACGFFCCVFFIYD